jgi:hypothetical protein
MHDLFAIFTYIYRPTTDKQIRVPAQTGSSFRCWSLLPPLDLGFAAHLYQIEQHEALVNKARSVSLCHYWLLILIVDCNCTEKRSSKRQSGAENATIGKGTGAERRDLVTGKDRWRTTTRCFDRRTAITRVTASKHALCVGRYAICSVCIQDVLIVQRVCCSDSPTARQQSLASSKGDIACSGSTDNAIALILAWDKISSIVLLTLRCLVHRAVVHQPGIGDYFPRPNNERMVCGKVCRKWTVLSWFTNHFHEVIEVCYCTSPRMNQGHIWHWITHKSNNFCVLQC